MAAAVVRLASRLDVLIAGIVLLFVITLLAFVAQRLISPGSGSSGTAVETVETV